MKTLSRLQFKLSYTLLALLVIALLTALGLWQVQRGQEKEALLQQAAQQETHSPLLWRPSKALPQMFQRLQLRGRYLPYTLLLDNQYWQHQWGYHVLNLLEVASGQVVLVDRGWVAGDLRRVILPVITIPKGWIEMVGQTYYPSPKGVILGDIVESKNASIMVVERVEPKLISNILHKKVYPFIMRLDKSALHGYVREWPIVAMSPQRHYAYALQWFVMALVVFVIYIYLVHLKK